MKDHFNNSAEAQADSQILCFICKKPVDKGHKCSYDGLVTRLHFKPTKHYLI